MDVSGQLHASDALPQGKEPQYVLGMRLSEPQSRSGRCGGEKILTLAGNRTRVIQPVAFPTEIN
jgi:hypothetical protein